MENLPRRYTLVFISVIQDNQNVVAVAENYAVPEALGSPPPSSQLMIASPLLVVLSPTMFLDSPCSPSPASTSEPLPAPSSGAFSMYPSLLMRADLPESFDTNRYHMLRLAMGSEFIDRLPIGEFNALYENTMDHDWSRITVNANVPVRAENVLGFRLAPLPVLDQQTTKQAPPLP